jgi:hypothetical protein
MSGYISPTKPTMVDFLCKSCKECWAVPAKEWVEGQVDGYDRHLWRPISDKPTRCLNCIAVCGAINKLSQLCFEHGWLATEGMAGKPPRASWEPRRKYIDSGHGSMASNGYASDGRLREDSKKWVEEMTKDVPGLVKGEEEKTKEEAKKKVEEKK